MSLYVIRGNFKGILIDLRFDGLGRVFKVDFSDLVFLFGLEIKKGIGFGGFFLAY